MASRNPEDLPKAPPDSYAWNNLIQDIIEAMDEADVKKIKRRFEGIFPMNVRTGEDIMDYLKENRYLSESDIVYLQQIVRVLENKDLLLKTINYANKSSQKVLHFRERKRTPRSGYEILKIHVEGFARTTTDYLQKLRHIISDITQAPHEEISFAGVEETNSFIITFVLPKMYVEVLQDLLGNDKKHYHFVPLLKIKVDEIIISGNSFKIKAATGKKRGQALEKSGKEENVSSLNIEHDLDTVKKSGNTYQ